MRKKNEQQNQTSKQGRENVEQILLIVNEMIRTDGYFLFLPKKISHSGFITQPKIQIKHPFRKIAKTHFIIN